MELKKYPNPILSKKCEDCNVGDATLKNLIKNMIEKLYEWNGVGLAAPQVGVSKNIVVIDVRRDPSVLYVMINPRIVWKSEEMVESDEGCLSIPFLRETIMRHELVTVEYLDETFTRREVQKAEGLLSACIQHEIDHLEGHLFIDRLSRLKRSQAIRKFNKLQKELRDQDIYETVGGNDV